MRHSENAQFCYSKLGWCHWLSSKWLILLYFDITCIICIITNKFCGFTTLTWRYPSHLKSSGVIPFKNSSGQSVGGSVPERRLRCLRLGGGGGGSAGRQARRWHNHHLGNEHSTGAAITITTGGLCSMIPSRTEKETFCTFCPWFMFPYSRHVYLCSYVQYCRRHVVKFTLFAPVPLLFH